MSSTASFQPRVGSRGSELLAWQVVGLSQWLLEHRGVQGPLHRGERGRAPLRLRLVLATGPLPSLDFWPLPTLPLSSKLRRSAKP